MSTTELHVEQEGERLDVFLARMLPQYSRSFWQKHCERGDITSNGQVLKPSQVLHSGQIIHVAMSPAPDFSQQNLPIIYQDDDVVVINKPAGLLTHAKGAISEEFSVGEFMRSRTTDGSDTNRPGIVHRLDRGTSGLIVAAKTPEAKRWLQKQFAERKVKKTYVALIEGSPTDPTALLDLPIERNPRKPQTFRVGPNGKTAQTTYHIKQAYEHSTLIQLQPLTGRTHQLRVHMAHLRHPIVGDIFYGAHSDPVGRIFLHAAELELTLPNRQRKHFVAPLPNDLADYLKTL